MRFALRFALLFALAAAAVIGGCYAHGPNPPPCTNLETCGDPTTPPPVWDRRAHDAGTNDGGTR